MLSHNFMGTSPYIYLDYNASTPVLDKVLQQMEPFHSKWFYNMKNPYSGKIRDHIENIRNNILKALGVNSGKVVFHAGATEALNSAIFGVAFYNLFHNTSKNHIIFSAVEHDGVIVCKKNLEQLGFKVSLCPVDFNGVIKLDVLESLIDNTCALVSIMHVNNETGVIQPIEHISKICRSKEVVFHSDGVLAIGRVDISNISNYVDIYTLSANKFYGPKGISLNYINDNVAIEPLICGSDNEYSLRAGTQNIPGIVGLYSALEITLKEQHQTNEKEQLLINELEKTLKHKIPDIRINGEDAPRICNTSNVSFKNLERDKILNLLIKNNICANSGATLLNKDASHVICAMYNDPDYIRGSIRFSVGRFSTMNEIQHSAKIIVAEVVSLYD